MDSGADTSRTAVGLIETRGLIGVLAAADAAAKTADVQLLGVERIGGGLVSLRFRGDTASVQAAVDAAREAARRVAEIVSTHVIPSPAIDVEGMLPAAPESSAPVLILEESKQCEHKREDLATLSVTRLRQLARKTPGLSLQGRQISRANKDELLDALRVVLGGAAGHTGD